ncbi:MAG: nitroreductase family protein [Robiginitomaculum sp.]|nr:nitroreductase family protein [Robiginitomaculum sp.]
MKFKTIALPHRNKLSADETTSRAETFFAEMSNRRTVRDFSPEPIPASTIKWAIRTAGTAPSGANKQPWTFVAISNQQVKAKIREAAEKEEKIFYAGKAGKQWLKDLAHLGTDEHKPFLETAPWLIVVFQQNYSIDKDTGERSKHYYIQESVGLASGLLIAALHRAGLATLTHTPSPMNFLRDLLGRPKSERAVMIVVAGFATDDARVPDIGRKSLDEIAKFIE